MIDFVFYLFPVQVLILHGGLFSQDGVTLEDIRNIDRNRQPPDSGLSVIDLLGPVKVFSHEWEL